MREKTCSPGTGITRPASTSAMRRRISVSHASPRSDPSRLAVSASTSSARSRGASCRAASSNRAASAIGKQCSRLGTHCRTNSGALLGIAWSAQLVFEPRQRRNVCGWLGPRRWGFGGREDNGRSGYADIVLWGAGWDALVRVISSAPTRYHARRRRRTLAEASPDPRPWLGRARRGSLGFLPEASPDPGSRSLAPWPRQPSACASGVPLALNRRLAKLLNFKGYHAEPEHEPQGAEKAATRGARKCPRSKSTT
jgi:hypothetical protein